MTKKIFGTIEYHCSPDKIEEFDTSKGCHFGGRLSAYEAALRKPGEGDLYLYRVNIKYTSAIFVEDQRNSKAWEDLAKLMRLENVGLARYKNIDEPDTVPSVFVTDPVKIDIISVTRYTRKQVEKIISSSFLYSF